MPRWVSVAAAVAAATAGLFLLRRWKQRPPQSCLSPEARRWLAERKGPVLCQLRRWKHSPNPSVFCSKVESFLRLNKIPHVVDYPKFPVWKSQRFPVVFFPDGTLVEDSTYIIEELKKRYVVKDAPSFSPTFRAMGHVLQMALEVHCYWCWIRLMFVDNIAHLREHTVMPVPKGPIRNAILSYMRRMLIQVLNGMGIGDLTDEQYLRQMKEDFAALERLIGDSEFLYSRVPSEFDCLVAPHVWNVLRIPVESPAREFVASSRILLQYAKRTEGVFYPDMDCVCSMTKGDTETFEPGSPATAISN